MTETAGAAGDAVAASARGASFLILLQVGSRALTFGLNQLLLRFLSPELLGAAVQLEVFVITAHHFSRESLRIASQRHSHGGIQAPVNLSYLSILGGLVVVAGLGEWYLTAAHPDVPFFVPALRLCELAAIVELISEPAFVVVQQKMLYKIRAAAEAFAVVIKTLTTAAAIFWSQRSGNDIGVIPFAAGELAYCATLTLVYLWQTSAVARQDHFSLMLSKLKTSSQNDYYLSVFSKPLVHLGISVYVQSGIKYILTQGDTFVSARFATLEDQGKYALSANYGGLIARMLLRPIEDSSRNLFAALCGDKQDSPSSAQNDSKTPEKKNTPQTHTQQAASTLQAILRFYAIASLFVVAVGPTAAPLLLHLVAGARWSQSGAGEILGTYCYSIPLLAINGVSEAFVSAAASPTELQRQSKWMAFFSIIFAGSTWLFLHVLQLGAKGLVLANCVNMGLRILFNLEFASRYFNDHKVEFPVLALLPNAFATAVTAVFATLIPTLRTSLAAYGVFGELVVVGALGFVILVLVMWSERRFLIGTFRQIKSK